MLAAVAATIIGRFVPRTSQRAEVSVRSEIRALRQGRLWLALAAAVLIMGGVLATYTYVAPLLAERAGIPAGAVPLVLLAFGAGALGGTAVGGRLGGRRPMVTTIPAAATTTLSLLALVPLSTTPAAAVALIFLMALAGFTINPVVTGLAVRFAGDAPTLTSALTTSAYNTGIAAGSALAGQALASSLGVTGPALVGAVFAGLTLLPLTAQAIAVKRRTTPLVAHGTAEAQERQPGAESVRTSRDPVAPGAIPCTPRPTSPARSPVTPARAPAWAWLPTAGHGSARRLCVDVKRSQSARPPAPKTSVAEASSSADVRRSSRRATRPTSAGSRGRKGWHQRSHGGA